VFRAKQKQKISIFIFSEKIFWNSPDIGQSKSILLSQLCFFQPNVLNQKFVKKNQKTEHPNNESFFIQVVEIRQTILPGRYSKTIQSQ